MTLFSYDFRDIIMSYLSSSSRKAVQTLFFQTADADSLAADIGGILREAGGSSPVRSLRFCIPQSRSLEPYYPFGEILRQSLRRKGEGDFLGRLPKSRVYPLHRPLLGDFLLGRTIRRGEELIPEEFDYEREMLIASIFHLMCAQLPGPCVVQIDNLHFARQSTFDMIRHILQSRLNASVLFVFSFEPNLVYQNVESQAWESFMESVSQKSFILEHHAAQGGRGIAPECQDAGEPAAGLLDAARSAYQLFAVQECLDLALYIWNKLDEQLSREEASELLCMIGNCYLLLNNPDPAMLYFNLMQKNCEDGNMQSSLCEAYRKISYTEYLKGETGLSMQYANLALKIARRIGDPVQEFRSLFVMLHTHSTITAFAHEFRFFYEEIYTPLVRMGGELGFINTLSYIRTDAISLIAIVREPAYESEIALTLCINGIENAKSCGNLFRLNSAYRTMGILFQAIEENEQALTYYRLSEKIITKMKRVNDLARLANSIGFFHFAQDSFSVAWRYFRKAIDMLEGTRAYDEICGAFYNVAKCHIFTANYERAIPFLEDMIAVMNLLNIDNFPFFPRINIYSLLGMCYVRCGQMPRALDLAGKIENSELYQRNVETFPFYEVFKAMIYDINGDAESAAARYEKAIEMRMRENLQTALFTFFEYVQMHERRGESEAARRVCLRALALVRPGEHPYFRGFFSSYLEGRPFQARRFSVPRSRFHTRSIIEFARQDNTLGMLHRKVKEMNFLQSVQNVIIRNRSGRPLIEEMMELVHSTFLLDNIYMLRSGAGGWDCVYQSGPERGVPLASLAGHLAQRKTELILSGKDLCGIHDELRDIHSVISIPLLHLEEGAQGSDYLVLCFVDKRDTQFSHDELKTLFLAARQLMIALELISAQEKLLANAVIDPLTGLFNRRELYARINEEIRRMRRSEQCQRQGFVVLFIDLDNFKYYNDTFGHQIGDIILREFARAMTAFVREIDVVGRYGGDEFVIMLPETTAENSMLVAQRIIGSMRSDRLYQDLIEESLGHPVSVPADRMLSCSIGIASYDAESRSDADRVLVAADAALYEAKRRGKNQVSVAD